MKGIKLKEITHKQCKPLLNEDAIVVLPIGGGVKEHGSHLPLGTDFFVTDFIAEKVVERNEVLLLPTLPYAYFPAFVDWEGSVSIQADNFIAYVKDIILSFQKFGVKKFLIIDGGVSTQQPLIILSRTLFNEYGIHVALTNILGLGREVEKEICQQKQGGHGDETETSCMLHINEKLVKMEETCEEYTTPAPGCSVNGILKVYMPGKMDTKSGINGNSTLATKEKGEKVLNAMIDDICNFLDNFRNFRGNN